jgi:acyl-CoA dehydrogenase
MLIGMILFVVVIFFLFLFSGQGYWAWVISGFLAFGIWLKTGVEPKLLFDILVIGFTFLALLFGVPPLRRNLITRIVMPILAKALPKMGETERTALDAGTVWWDGDLFSGDPDWRKLLRFKMGSPIRRRPSRRPRGGACRRIDDWQVVQDRDLPADWDFIKKHKFLGMIIPEQYGGLEFSLTPTWVITKLSAAAR